MRYIYIHIYIYIYIGCFKYRTARILVCNFFLNTLYMLLFYELLLGGVVWCGVVWCGYVSLFLLDGMEPKTNNDMK